MIICEEKAFERILSLGFCDTAIPFSIRKNSDDEAIITVLPSLKKTAKKFESEFSDNYFSNEAHNWIRESIRPFMYSIGYKDNRQSRKISLIMSLDDSITLSDSDGAVILKSAMKNLTSADIDSLIEFGHIVSAVIVDNCVVACAYTNLNPNGAAEVEIGVETAPAYRHRGYAKKALKKLISELHSRNISPIYICSASNRASLKLAASCGFVPEAYEYNYVFRRI